MLKLALASSAVGANAFVSDAPSLGVRAGIQSTSSSQILPAAWSSSTPSSSSSQSYSYDRDRDRANSSGTRNVWGSAGLLACGIAAGALVNSFSRDGSSRDGKRKNQNVGGRKSASVVQARGLVKVSPIPEEGKRTIMKTTEGNVIVTKQLGKYYAVNARCPHMGLPMKRGAIEVDKESGEG